MRFGPLYLTDTEWTILKHRLEVPHAIADALELRSESRQHIVEIATFLSRGEWEEAKVSAVNDELFDAILEDAITGNVYIASMADAVGTEGQYASYCKCGRKLAEKVGDYIGKDISIPEQ